MRSSSRFMPIALGAALATALAGCSYSSRTVALEPTYTTVPATTVVTAPASLEFGRVANIEYFPGGRVTSGVNVQGAILGAVAGAVAGNLAGRAIGGDSTRDTATVLGGAAGAAIGSQTGRSASATDPVYRVSIHTDQGVMRIYDVPGTGDLRIGDRVRVENGVIYRS